MEHTSLIRSTSLIRNPPPWQLADERNAALATKAAVAHAVGEARLSGRAELLALTAPVAWLPLPVETDPFLLGWFDPSQLRPLWSDTEGAGAASVEELPKPKACHSLV
eukprot:3026581-Prymnesium_polylepis.1